jgi:hypothetical protein
MTEVTDIGRLQAGEVKRAEYQVQIARPTASGWVASIPPLMATITNRRLLLVPQTRKPYPPASIPGIYILKVTPVRLSERRAVQIRLRIGYNLNLFVGLGQGDDFANHLRLLLKPHPKTRFAPSLSQNDLVRLIRLISQI